MLNIFKPKCNCKYFWQQKLVEAEYMYADDYIRKTLLEMGYTYVYHFCCDTTIVIDDECFSISDSIMGCSYAKKYACVSCGTCLGWNIDDSKLRRNIKKEIERQHKINKEKQFAKKICSGDMQ